MPASRESLILAIDIGTSSVRTALFNECLCRVPGSLTQIVHATTHSEDGAAELDLGTLEANLCRCLDGTVPKAGRRKVIALGVTSFWHSLVGSDAKGNALTPIYTWADSRCVPDAAQLREELFEERYHAQTGCMLRASYWPAKLRWLARTRRGLFRRVARWQSPADWLHNRFCENGNDLTAHGMATGTGLYNPVTMAWDKELTEVSGAGEGRLPSIGTSSLVLRAAYRKRYPPLAEAKWWPAIGDGAASNLGSGAAREGTAAINVGTSAALRFMRRGADARAPFGLFCYRVDTERYLIGGAVSNAGNLRAWCHRELNLPKGDKVLEKTLAARAEPLRSLVVLPFWSAERAPTWCENLDGVIVGLSQNTSAVDLLQATTEAVYQRLALIANLCMSARKGSRADSTVKIIVSGGILKSASLLQRLADVLGRPVCCSMEPEASLRGAAMYAASMEGMDAEHLGDNKTAAGPAIRPRPRIATLYARERQRQQRLEALMAASPV